MEAEKKDSIEADEVKGPKDLLTDEQVRTRGTHVNKEGAVEWKLRTDKNLSTLRQNLNGAGVDDRRDHTRIKVSDKLVSGDESRNLGLPLGE